MWTAILLGVPGVEVAIQVAESDGLAYKLAGVLEDSQIRNLCRIQIIRTAFIFPGMLRSQRVDYGADNFLDVVIRQGRGEFITRLRVGEAVALQGVQEPSCSLCVFEESLVAEVCNTGTCFANELCIETCIGAGQLFLPSAGKAPYLYILLDHCVGGCASSAPLSTKPAVSLSCCAPILRKSDREWCGMSLRLARRKASILNLLWG